MKAPDILRRHIKKCAEDQGIFNNKIPSRIYCHITIKALSDLIGVSEDELTTKIESFNPEMVSE